MFSGWSDWSLKLHDLKNSSKIWSLDQCHKGGVTAIDLSQNMKNICTGGNDGYLRLIQNCATLGTLYEDYDIQPT